MVAVARVDGGHRLVGESSLVEFANRWLGHLEGRQSGRSIDRVGRSLAPPTPQRGPDLARGRYRLSRPSRRLSLPARSCAAAARGTRGTTSASQIRRTAISGRRCRRRHGGEHHRLRGPGDRPRNQSQTELRRRSCVPSAITGPVPTIRTSAGHWRCSAPSGTACGRKRPRHRARVAAQQAAASRSCPSERRAHRGVSGLYRGVDATSAQCLQTCRRHRRRRRLGRRGVVVRFPPATAPRNVVGRSTGLDGDPPLRPPEPRSTIAY